MQLALKKAQRQAEAARASLVAGQGVTLSADTIAFRTDLVKALLASSIPLNKLNGPLGEFIRTYTGREVIDRSHLGTLIPGILERVEEEDRKWLLDKHVALALDETLR